MKCEIINVGTELLLGDILTTNAQFLAQEISTLGFDMYYQSIVGDNHDRLLCQINEKNQLIKSKLQRNEELENEREEKILEKIKEHEIHAMQVRKQNQYEHKLLQDEKKEKKFKEKIISN